MPLRWSPLHWWGCRQNNDATLAAIGSAALCGVRFDLDLRHLPPELRQRLQRAAAETWGALTLTVPETSTPELAGPEQRRALAALDAVRAEIAAVAGWRLRPPHRLWLVSSAGGKAVANVVSLAARRDRRTDPPDGAA